MSPYDWSAEEIAARRHALEAVAVAVCLLAIAALTGAAIYLLLTGRFAGWLCAAGAAVLVVVVLYIAEDLDDQP